MVKLLKRIRKSPVASIILPVYNSSKYLKESLKSLLNQSFTNFELIIINDGSTDNSVSIIKKERDNRIKRINHKINEGLVYSLNEGLKIAKGQYLIRMDPDDIANTDRIKKQISFLELNKHIDIVGSWIENFGKYNYIWKVPETDNYIKAKLIFENSLAHPSVAIRAQFIRNINAKYKSNYHGAEDYMLWSELASIGANFANIQEVLLKYRTHDTQIGESLKKVQQESSWLIRKYNLNRLGINPSILEKNIHQKLSSWIPLSNITEVLNAGLWLTKILISNYIKDVYDKTALTKIVGEKWAVSCYIAGSNNIRRAAYLLICPWLLPLSIKILYLRARGTLYERC